MSYLKDGAGAQLEGVTHWLAQARNRLDYIRRLTREDTTEPEALREQLRILSAELNRAELRARDEHADERHPPLPAAPGEDEDPNLSLLAEALHTGWRKGTDGTYAHTIWKLIQQSFGDEWGDYVYWVHQCLGQMGYQAPQEKDGQ